MKHTSTGFFARLRVAVGLLCLFLAQPPRAPGSPPPPEGQQDMEGLRLMRRTFADKLDDIHLINHRGEKVRLFSDLVRDRAVIFSFFYTSCSDACPLTNSKMARLRQQLKPIFGRSIHLVSISVDAEHDTPARVARYAGPLVAQSADPDLPDWQMLTGNAGEILKMRQQMGLVDPDPDVDSNPSTHGSMLIFGNQGTGRWSMLNSKLPIADIVNRVKRIAGWTQDLRYEDIRNEVRGTQQAAHAQAPAVPAVSASVAPPAEPPLPVLGKSAGNLGGVERSGHSVRLAELRGKVTVLSHLYTVCPHGSRAVIAAMRSLHAEFGAHPAFHQVSLSAATERETPAYFRSYAESLGLDARAPWWFITAERAALDVFTAEELGLAPSTLIPEEQRLNAFDMYDNDLRLVLLDAEGQVRGRYQVLHPDPETAAASLEQLRKHVRLLVGQPVPAPASVSLTQ